MNANLKRVFLDPFRIFFIAAGLYAVFSLSVWELWLGVRFAGGMMGDMPFAAAPHMWHAHEMIFGFASAAIGGFLLTAVPSWTGSTLATQAYVPFAAAVWLAGRLAIWVSGSLPPGLVAVVDLTFLPLIACQVALMLIRRPKPQNVAFLAFLALVWTGNRLVHLEWMGLTRTLDTGMRVGLSALCVMIGVIGGRVTPGFTRNALKRAGRPEDRLPRSRRPIDLTAIILIASVPLTLLFGMSDRVTGVLAVLGGGTQILRIAFWGAHLVLRQPILWVMHLSMVMLGIGLLLWGLSLLGFGSEVAALHVLGIGAVGGMTLAVMSRAILGHSGRDLVAPGAVALAYALIALAAALRWAASTLSDDLYIPAVLITGGLWIVGFALYISGLWPAFIGPRLPHGS